MTIATIKMKWIIYAIRTYWKLWRSYSFVVKLVFCIPTKSPPVSRLMIRIPCVINVEIFIRSDCNAYRYKCIRRDMKRNVRCIYYIPSALILSVNLSNLCIFYLRNSWHKLQLKIKAFWRPLLVFYR